MSENVAKVSLRNWIIIGALWLTPTVFITMVISQNPPYDLEEQARIETIGYLGFKREGPQEYGCLVCDSYHLGERDLTSPNAMTPFIERGNELGCNLNDLQRYRWRTSNYKVDGLEHTVACVKF